MDLLSSSGNPKKHWILPSEFVSRVWRLAFTEQAHMRASTRKNRPTYEETFYMGLSLSSGGDGKGLASVCDYVRALVTRRTRDLLSQFPLV